MVLNVRAKDIMQGMFSSVGDFMNAVGINSFHINKVDNISLSEKRKNVIQSSNQSQSIKV